MTALVQRGPRHSGWALLLPIFFVLIHGGNIVVSKLAATAIAPETISFYRWLVAAVVIAPFLTGGLIREWPVVRRHLWQLFSLSMLGMVVCQGLVYVAAASTSATQLAIVNSLIPMISVIFSVMLLSYRPGCLVLLGCAISLVGAVELVQKGNPAAVFSHVPDIADLYLLVAVVMYALYGVLLRHWKLPLSTPTLFFAQVLIAVIATAPAPMIGTWSPLTAYSAGLVAIAGVLGSAVAPFLWMKSIQTVGPVASAVFINFIPLIGTTIAVTFLGERVETYHLLGGGLIIGGVVLAQVEGFLRAPAAAK